MSSTSAVLTSPPAPLLVGEGSKTLIFSFLLLIIFLALGCSTPKRMKAVPPELQEKAAIPGMPDVRYWADTDTAVFLRDAVESLDKEKAYLAKSGYKGPLPEADFLAISGGGDDGAFGAGLLVGWTAAGKTA